MIPANETMKPLYRPAIPSVAIVFLYTSSIPLYCLSEPPGPPVFVDIFASLANRVRAKSKEYTKTLEEAPAVAPDARFPANHFQ